MDCVECVVRATEFEKRDRMERVMPPAEDTVSGFPLDSDWAISKHDTKIPHSD